jgi:hypothetical protein
VVLARDSDAVFSVFYPEQRWIGKLLSTADGGSSALCYVLQAVCVVLGVLQLLTGAAMFAEMAGMLAPNPLLHVSMTLGGIAYFPLALVIGSARKALQPGGALEQLKVGEAMISEQDSTTLWRWRVGLGVLSALWFLFGLCFLALGLLAPPDANGEPMPAAVRITNTLTAVVCCGLFPVAFSDWWASMFTASCLCRDEVVEVIHNVRSADPNSDEWDEAVAEPGLALIEKMELLSAGWSGGLAGFAAFSWLGALSNFTMAINTPLCEGVDAARGWSPGTMRTIWLVTTAICTTLPFLLALDIAATSTWCDNLMAELNDARINHGPESHLKIQWLETALEKLVRQTASRAPPLLCACLTEHSTNVVCVLPEQWSRPGFQSRRSGHRQEIHEGLGSQALRCPRHSRWSAAHSLHPARHGRRQRVRAELGADQLDPIGDAGAQLELRLQHDCRLCPRCGVNSAPTVSEGQQYLQD